MSSARPALLRAFLLLLPVLATPASAEAPSEVAPGPYRLGYTAYAGGIEVLRLDVVLDLSGEAYSVALAGETQGLLGMLFSWRTRSHAQGRLEASGPRPEAFRSTGRWRGKDRRAMLDWDEEGGLAARVEPAAEEEGREPVPPALLAGALDPLSAVVGELARPGAAGACTGSVPVYDGRRRYDLTFRQAGRRMLGDSGYSAYAGEAVVCEVGVELLAGRSREDRNDGRARPRPPSRVMLAPVVEGLPPLPVRIEAEGRLGPLVLHLDRIGAPVP